MNSHSSDRFARHTSGAHQGKRPAKRAGAVRAAVPPVETLERRVLLSADIPSPLGPELRVNTYTPSYQRVSRPGRSIGGNADGSTVVIWESSGNDAGANQADVYGQRYSATGAAVGGEFRVNSTTTYDQHSASVAVDAAGGFVVAWTSLIQDGSGFGVYAQRYASDGARAGGEFRVNTTTASDQANPSVAIDGTGAFVVAWTSLGQDGSGLGVYAQRYAATGTAVGGEFRVNTTTASDQQWPAVAADPAGNVVVAWESNGQDGSGWGVYAQRYGADGTALGSEYRVNTTTADWQRRPSVAADPSGNVVVAWQSDVQDGSGYGVYAQRYSAGGAAVGSEFRINTTTAGGQISPSVATGASGNFVVAWISSSQDGDGLGVYGRQYDGTGAAVGAEFRVNTTTTDDQTDPSVAAYGAESFTVAWTGKAPDGKQDVFAQRFGASAPTVTAVRGGDDEVLVDGGIRGHTVAGLVVEFSEEMSAAGGAAGANSVTNPANYRLTRNGVDASGLIGPVTFALRPDGRYAAVVGLTTPLTGAGYALTVRQTVQDLVGNALDGNRDGTAGGDHVLGFNVAQTPASLGGEFRVNTTTAGDQRIWPNDPRSVAADAAGNFVVAWTSFNQDGSGQGVYAQRYAATGAALSGEFRVNTTTAGHQYGPAVAFDGNGNFVIAWASEGQDGSGYGVYAQRYSASGTAVGTEFRVNTVTTGDQWYPSVAADGGGSFVVAWMSNGQDGSGDGIYAQRYDAAGAAAGAEFRVSATTAGNQQYPSAAADGAGNFVVAWMSTNVASAIGIYTRRYNAAGTALGGEVRVNVTPAFNSYMQNPSATMDGAGNLIVAWSSYNQDGSEDGIYARRYDATGAAAGGEFRVNTTTVHYQYYPTVAADGSGNFVVAWASYNQDGSGSGIFGQRYSAAGAAVGSEFRISTATRDSQLYPSVAMLAGGRFVTVWQSAGQDGSGLGVFAQRSAFSNSAPTAAAGGPYAVAEGGAVQLSGAASSDPDGDALTYAWDLDGDGVFGETGIAAGRGDETGAAPTFAAAGLNGVAAAVVSLRVTDASGTVSDNTATATIQISNAPPSAAIDAPPTAGTVGAALAFAGSGTDPSPADAAGLTYAWSVTRNGSPYPLAAGTATKAAAFAFTPAAAGTYLVSLVVTDPDGAASAAATAAVEVAKAASAVALSAPGWTYDGAPHAATAAVTGVAAVPAPTGSPTLTYYVGTSASGTPVAAPSGAGTYTVVAHYAGDANYLPADSAAATFAVAPAPSETAVTGGTFTYTGTARGAAASSVTGAGGLAAAATSLAYYDADDHLLAGAPADAGTYTVVAAYAGDVNHAGSTSAPAAITIAKAALTVTADDAAKAYDGLAFTGGNGVTYAGFVNGEAGGVLGGALAYGGTAQGATNAGSYTITAGGLTSGNYEISYAPGTLTVGKAASATVVTVPAGTLVYNGQGRPATAAVTGPGGLAGPVDVTYERWDGAAWVAVASTPTGGGQYRATAVYAGSADHLGSEDVETFTIARAAAPAVAVTAVTGMYGKAVTLTAKLSGGNGGSLAGRTVAFTLNGLFQGYGTTNASGIATYTGTLTGITPGKTYAAGVGATFVTDADYLGGTQKTAALTVYDAAIVGLASTASYVKSAGTFTMAFTQARDAAAAADFTATVSWGGSLGSTAAAVTRTAAGQFELAAAKDLAAGTYSLAVTITSRYGTSTRVLKTITVA